MPSIGSGGSLLNTSANPFDANQGGKLGNWDVVGGALDKWNPYVGGQKKQNQTSDQMNQNVQQQYQGTEDVLNKQNQQGQEYMGGLMAAGQQYKAGTAENVNAYTGGIQSALKDWQTPNNATEQGIQGMYNQQAQGITKQGLADYGVLAALGGQATANTVGASGQPMTGGQMQALQGANLSQAGNEFAQAQSQASGLQAQGLQAGLNQNNLNFANTTGVAQNVMGANQGLASTNYNTDMGYANAQYGIDQAQNNAQLAAQAQMYGGQQGVLLGNQQYQQGLNSGSTQVLGSVLGGLAGGAGAAMARPSQPQQQPLSGNTAPSAPEGYPGNTPGPGGPGSAPYNPNPYPSPSGNGPLALTGYQPGSSFPQGSPYNQPYQGPQYA